MSFAFEFTLFLLIYSWELLFCVTILYCNFCWVTADILALVLTVKNKKKKEVQTQVGIK